MSASVYDRAPSIGYELGSVTLSTTDLCRFTVATPTTYADVAVPESALVCEVVPLLVEHSGDHELAGRPVVLQRLGEDPFEPDRTIHASGVRDGETLFLRLRQQAAPPMLFDDLVDGVGRAVSDGFDRWSAPFFVRWLILLSTLPLLAGVALHLSLPVSSAVAGSALLGAAVLLSASFAAGRAFGDRELGLALATMGVLYGAVAGWALGVVLFIPEPSGPMLAWPPSPEQVVITVGIVVAGTLLAMWMLGELWAPLAVVAAVGLIVTPYGVAVALTDADPALLGATSAVILMLVGPQLPTIAYRLARLAPPDLAQEPADLRSEIVTPLVGNEVLALGRSADGYLTILTVASAVVAGGGLAIASGLTGVGRVVVAVAIVGHFLRARPLRNPVQKLAAVAAGTVGALGVGVGLVSTLEADQRLAVGSVAALGVAGLCIVVCRMVLPRRMSPLWGRAADLGESLIAVSAIPLTLWAHGAFGFARGLAG